ncbi:hypothetical protein LEP1GSC061_0153 [Leptospira wolffii serovar Khorat str. Khorat-H2]|nr:hypothetical protein LEP1GSC061_0153 [Leptospira wolffii serovar Khorat str. Khorat-H2]
MSGAWQSPPIYLKETIFAPKKQAEIRMSAYFLYHNRIID